MVQFDFTPDIEIQFCLWRDSKGVKNNSISVVKSCWTNLQRERSLYLGGDENPPVFARDGLREDGLRHVGGAEGAEPDDEGAPRVALERVGKSDEERHDGNHGRDEYDGPPPTALDGYLVES